MMVCYSSKVYLDCTHTYNSGLNTGIQRVVKNIVKNIKELEDEFGLEIIPITAQNNTYLKFDTFPHVNKKNNSLKVLLKNKYIKFRALLSKILPKKIYDILYSPRLNIYLSTTIDKLLFSKKINIENEVQLQANDTLILMDAIWLHNDYSELAKLKKAGVKIVAIIYDIIPISHSQFCAIDLTIFLKDWYKKAYKYIDGYICISESVKDDIFEYIQQNIDKNIDMKKFDYFYLGAKFTQNNDISNVPQSFKQIFDSSDTYLSVSTIEPRKNHKYILDCFDALWENNIDVKYVIVRKIGWEVDSLVKRIKSHKEYNKRLFLLTDVNDARLIYAYKNSTALVFASFIEGFGLPIVESLFYKLPVLASNIPIHKEIGKDNISYFDLTDSNSLFSIIKNKNIKQVDNFIWQDWYQSTKELILKSRGF